MRIYVHIRNLTEPAYMLNPHVLTLEPMQAQADGCVRVLGSLSLFDLPNLIIDIIVNPNEGEPITDLPPAPPPAADCGINRDTYYYSVYHGRLISR